MIQYKSQHKTQGVFPVEEIKKVVGNLLCKVAKTAHLTQGKGQQNEYRCRQDHKLQDIGYHHRPQSTHRRVGDHKQTQHNRGLKQRITQRYTHQFGHRVQHRTFDKNRYQREDADVKLLHVFA